MGEEPGALWEAITQEVSECERGGLRRVSLTWDERGFDPRTSRMQSEPSTNGSTSERRRGLRDKSGCFVTSQRAFRQG